MQMTRKDKSTFINTNARVGRNIHFAILSLSFDFLTKNLWNMKNVRVNSYEELTTSKSNMINVFVTVFQQALAFLV